MVRGKECVLGPGSVSHSTFTRHSRPCYPISSTHSTPWDLRELLYLGVVVVRGLRSVHGYRDMQPKCDFPGAQPGLFRDDFSPARDFYKP